MIDPSEIRFPHLSSSLLMAIEDGVGGLLLGSVMCARLADGRAGSKTRFVNTRAGVIPALESASESDFGSFWTTNLSDSGSGSFTLESLESAPVLEPIQTVKIAWKSPFLLCEN